MVDNALENVLPEEEVEADTVTSVKRYLYRHLNRQGIEYMDLK